MEKYLSVVIPVLNEAENIPILYEGIKRAVLGLRHEIIFIDDGSTDNTPDLLRRIAENDRCIKAIRMRKSIGKSAVYSLGFEQASGDIIITMDGDLQDDPKEISHFLQKLDEGYDLVSGWKFKRKDPFLKNITSKIFNLVTAITTGVKIHDFNCGFKAYRREVVENIDIYGELYRFIPALAEWRGYRVAEIKVEHHARKFGRSKYGLARFPKGFFDLLTILLVTRYARRPLHFFGGLGLAFVFLGVVINLYLCILKITTGAAIGHRPLLLFGVLLVIVGIQFISLGLIAEMITNLSLRRERSIVDRAMVEEIN